MAHISSTTVDIVNSSKTCTRELFPTNDDDSDELGHISPLSDSTPPDSPYLEGRLSDQNHKSNNVNFSKSTISDYIILENICNADKRDVTRSVETTEEIDSDSKHPCESNDNIVLSLYPSPMQKGLQQDNTSPKNCIEHQIVLNKSPSFNLKTPQSTSTVPMDVPKLIRKSPLLKSSSNVEVGKRKMPFSESPPTTKHPKLDTGSRVRTVLFPKADIVVPTSSFYTKCDSSYHSQKFKYVSVRTKKTNQRSSSLYLCGRKKGKNGLGQINAGVKHNIRKPKPKKIAETQLLKVALNITDNSPLNGYLDDIQTMFAKQNTSKPQLQDMNNKTFTSTTSQSFDEQINTEDKITEALQQEITTQNRKRELSPSPDPNKKFFKFKRSNATVTVDKHLKLGVSDGKLSILENNKYNKKYKAVNELKFHLDATDLIVPENENLISPEKINDILFNLDNENNKENDINMDQVNPEGTEQLVLKAHNSVAMSENAIHLHTISEQGQCRNNSLTLNCSLVTRQQDDKSILLSPTSQMCNMTSGLALNSPKKAQQNITSILAINGCSTPGSPNEISFASDMEQEKLFPIFSGANKVAAKTVRTSKPIQPPKKLKPLPKNQMLLDAGQKKFGATQCSECKFVYHMGDPNDELIHLNYHNAGNIFRFSGWKDEHVMAEFPNARIIRVLPSDPKPWLRKVKELLEVVNRNLGYYEMQVNLDYSQIYLYIKHRTIAGCLVAESKTTAYRMLSDNIGIDLCSEESYPIKCGVNRIWVSQACRKEGIATSLMNCLRSNFVYGCILTKNDIAFSSPTEAGKAFAKKYFNTANFLIYTC